ncbi:hypothetical protein BJ165DRAFT_1561505 [Panaeolus papilionaceus]|nr:hypothetical protein BJ165DRAFT_1561505 [Panaeolus papilionaceus]
MIPLSTGIDAEVLYFDFDCRLPSTVEDALRRLSRLWLSRGEPIDLPQQPQTQGAESPTPAHSVPNNQLILQAITTEELNLPHQFLNSDVYVLLKRPIEKAITRCTQDVLELVVDPDAVLSNFNNAGVQKYRKYAGAILQRTDESFEAVVYASYTLRRLDLYASTATTPTPEDRKALGELMRKTSKEILELSIGFGAVSLAMDELFQNSSLFLPKNAPVAEDLGFVHAHRRIVEYVKADLIYKYGKDDLPKLFDTLKNLIINMEGYSADCQVVAEWMNQLHGFARILWRDCQDVAYEPQSWRCIAQDMIAYLIPYMSQIPIIVSLYPQDDDKKFFAKTRKLMKEMKHVYYSPTSVDNLLPSPPRMWQHHELERSSRTIVAQSVPLYLSDDFNRFHKVDIIARLTSVEDFGHNEYGIKINVQIRDVSDYTNRRLYRCTRLDIRCAFAPPDDRGAEPRVKAFRPDGGSFDKSEVKYTVKHAAKLQPSAAIKIGELSSEWGKETVERQYGIIQGIYSEQQSGIHWVLMENRSSRGGIPDADVGAVIMSPTTQITVNLSITVKYHVRRSYLLIPWTMRQRTTVAGSLSLNLPDSMKLSLLTLSKDQDEFLQGCTIKHIRDS